MMIKRGIKGLFLTGAIFFNIINAYAADTAMTWGGAPMMLSGHKGIQMKSERIFIVVSDRRVRTECLFVFVNKGPACKIRIGFPDVGVGAADPDEEKTNAELANTPPKSVFSSFQAFINGQAVPTALTRGKNRRDIWHVKVVAFPANSTTMVKDIYTENVGGLVANANDSLQNVHYVLHTGSSWNGNLGKTEIIIKLKSQSPRPPFSLIPLRPYFKKMFTEANSPIYYGSTKHHPTANTLYYAGPSVPKVIGTTLIFTKTNYKPKEIDDLDLYFK